jgi:large subunit ribosomal protein L24
MTKKFSTSWNSSKKPTKQRNYIRNAPLHVKRKLLGVHLSPELRKKYSVRTITLVKGDKVKILRGQFKKRENKVEKIDIKTTKVIVTGIERTKKDGSKSQYPITPSNLMITELNLEDKKRKTSLNRKSAKGKTDKIKTDKITTEKKNKNAEIKVEKKTETPQETKGE